jgi:hypothetical protein
MDAAQFRKIGHEMIDFIADYHENVGKYPVTPGSLPPRPWQDAPQTFPPRFCLQRSFFLAVQTPKATTRPV